MRTLDSFIVKLDKTRKDTLKLDNGMELYLDSKYNEFQHRVTGGEVVSTPARYDLGVEVGDTLYFHHHVVIQKGQHLGLEENDGLYVVRYDHEQTLAVTAKRNVHHPRHVPTEPAVRSRCPVRRVCSSRRPGC